VSGAGSRGLLVSLEGIDGSGKSTQARLLADALAAAGREVLLTREPGGAPGAEEIRRLLVEGEPGRWSAETEILLFTAARRDHVERTILPALGAGLIVLCDRFVDSTRAYQGTDSGRRALIDRLHQSLIGIDPDLSLLFDIDTEGAAARAAARDGAEGRQERLGPDCRRAIRQRFLGLAAAEPERFAVIDADRPAEVVAADAMAAVETRLGLPQAAEGARSDRGGDARA